MYKVIKRNGSVFGTEPCLCEFICDTTDDVSALPTSITKGTGGKTKYDNQVCGSGSIAVVVDNGTNPKRYILDNHDVWCPQPAEGGGGSAQDLSGYAKKTDIPTELPANGGNADTVNNHTIESDVPTNAVFTDTWRGIQNNLTSDSTTDSLSAAQGKVLKGLVDGKAASSHTHSEYASKSKYGDTTINIGRVANAPIGEHSASLGIGTVANGYASTAEGLGSQASGEGAHAGGNSSLADNNSSFAHGYQVRATHDYETAFGKHNVSNDDTLFSIGDGTSYSDRHNAFEITTTGGKLHDKDIATTNQIINNNLLINPDFKINQRSISGTFSETGKYFVDRWRLVSGTVTVNTDSTLMLNGTISQIFENAVGDNVTSSVSAGTAVYDNSTKTFSITANGETVSWAKLEYGSMATQFIPPDTAAEFLKCMRYYEILLPSAVDRSVVGYLETDMKALFDIKFSVPKRCPPTLMSSMARIIVNTIGSYIVISNNCAIKQAAVDKHGIAIYTVDPIISSSPTGYTAVTIDAMSVTDIAVDAEIY